MPSRRCKGLLGSPLVESSAPDQWHPLIVSKSGQCYDLKMEQLGKQTCMYRCPLRFPRLQQVKELPGHQRAWICLLESASFADYIFRRVWPLDTLISSSFPPVSHVLYLLLVKGVFTRSWLIGFGEQLKAIGGQCVRDRRLHGPEPCHLWGRHRI